MKKAWLVILPLFGILFISYTFKGLPVQASPLIDQSLSANRIACTPGAKYDGCGSEQRCEKTGDSAYCTCTNTGYVANGYACKDVDECKKKEIRKHCKNKVAKCDNTPGSYKCRCKTGFEMNSAEHKCVDVDECEELGTCHEKAICQNTWGSYSCTCVEGFAGDGFECVVDTAYKQQKKIQLTIMVGCAAGGGVLLIIALIAFFWCARKKKKEEEEEAEEGIEKMASTLSEYGQEWDSDSSEDEDDE